jgi:Cdc6-like AAA superfamily ATPase
MFGSELKAENARLSAELASVKGELRAALNEFTRAAEARGERERDHNRQLQAVEQRLAESEAERKVLLDRILELSGQQALFQRQSPADGGQQAVQNELPGPPTQVGFDHVHAVARQALKDGTFRLKRAQ